MQEGISNGEKSLHLSEAVGLPVVTPVSIDILRSHASW